MFRRVFLILLIVSSFISCHTAVSLKQLPSQYLFCDNIRLHYKTYGQGEQPLVFIHGFGCDMECWREQFPFFATRDVAMVFIDLPGYGGSDKPQAEYSPDFFAKAVKTVLDSLHATRPVLVGHSLGSPLCRQVVRNYPELNARLCKVDEVALRFPRDSVEKLAYQQEVDVLPAGFTGEHKTENMETFIHSLFIPESPQKVKEYAFATMSTTPEYIAYSTMQNLVKERYWDETLVDVPTLIVCARTFLVWPDNEAYMRLQYPDLEYHEWNGTGHFIMMEQPERFNQVLYNFINKKEN